MLKKTALPLSMDKELLARQLYDVAHSAASFDNVKAQLVALLNAVPAPPRPAPTEQTVAFLGLGAMGKAVSARLESCATVRKWNRSPTPERTVATVDEAVAGVPVVFSMLANDSAARQVVLDRLVHCMQPGAVHVSLATLSVALVAEIEAAHAARGQHFVNCPVFGRPDAAARGMLFALPGGTVPAHVAELLKSFSQRAIPFERPVQSALAKLCGNFLIASTILSLSEVMVLAEKGGISNHALLAMLTGTLFASPIVVNYGNIIANRQFTPPGFQLRLGLKDVNLFLEAGGALDCPSPVGHVLRDRFLSTLAQHPNEDLDWSAIMLAVRSGAGM